MTRSMETQVTYQIRTALGTTEGLIGLGLEQIEDVVSGEVIARFWNGSLVSISSPSLSRAGDRLKDEPTLLLNAA